MRGRFLLLLLLLLMDVGHPHQTSDSCDWFGSGVWDEDEYEEPGVAAVSLRCESGAVEWRHPRGGLRLVLSRGGAHHEFRACVKLSAEWSGAHVYHWQERSLEAVHLHVGRPPPPHPLCFPSRGGSAVLYLEAASRDSHWKAPAAALLYHLKPYAPGTSFFRRDEECRPCTPEELVHLYCSSDFAAVGYVTGVAVDETSGRGEVAVRASRVLHDGHRLLANGTARLVVPAHCGAKHGPGLFLLLGHVELREPVLACAPALHEWAHARALALRHDSAPCGLDDRLIED